MMSVTMEVSRRNWMVGGLTAMAEIAAAQQHAHEAIQSVAPPRFEVLDAAMAGEVEALTAQIIPSGDGPGAREAGVVYFIDRALATFEADKREAYQTGMRALQLTRQKLFPASASVATLTAAQQIQLLRSVEKSAFFELPSHAYRVGFRGLSKLRRQSRKIGLGAHRLR